MPHHYDNYVDLDKNNCKILGSVRSEPWGPSSLLSLTFNIFIIYSDTTEPTGTKLCRDDVFLGPR